ncbi:hypothetical protein [Clostridium saccharoperbutylacetonicum]|uniref:hypothetical protein n=1 Tax=Clostridium saccharoperbutylacetonicum TaxID=36745 RepID=UPI0039EC0176
MKSEEYSHDCDLEEMKEDLLEITKACSSYEMKHIFDNIKDILHLTTMVMHGGNKKKNLKNSMVQLL